MQYIIISLALQRVDASYQQPPEKCNIYYIKFNNTETSQNSEARLKQHTHTKLSRQH